MKKGLHLKEFVLNLERLDDIGVIVPTILFVMGWRFFFYSNEGNEPIHVHCRKGEKECKYWLDTINFDLDEAYNYNLNDKDKRQVKKIIFEYFEYIENEWDTFQKEKKDV